MKPATNKTRATRVKLEALIAAPGTPEEGKAAQKNLARSLPQPVCSNMKP